MNLTQEQKEKLNAQLDQWIEDHREEYIKDVSDLCRIRSVSEEAAGDKPFGEACHEMLMASFRLAESYGFRTKIIVAAPFMATTPMAIPSGLLLIWTSYQRATVGRMILLTRICRKMENTCSAVVPPMTRRRRWLACMPCGF